MKKNILMYMGGNIRRAMEKTDECVFMSAREIRIRVNKPLVICTDRGEIFLDRDGNPAKEEKAFRPAARDIALTAEILGGYSLYAFDEELKNGFITIEGGHRAGLCGRAVTENGHIKTLRNISSINLRLARQINGCAEGLLKYIADGKNVFNTLIVSPPGGGKTTVLRDLIRCISGGMGLTVGVCDERSEIAATYMGMAQNDLGPRTDIIDGCPKSQGIYMLLRSMAPKVIAADEIGSKEDVKAIEEAVISGVRLICTAHAEKISDIEKKPYRAAFERFVLLGAAEKPGRIKAVYDKGLKELTGFDN